MVMFKIANKIFNREKICLMEDPYGLANSTTDPKLVYPQVFFYKLLELHLRQNVFFLAGHHCVKSVRIRSFSGPFFFAFGLNAYSVRMRENTDQKNSKYGHFLSSALL